MCTLAVSINVSTYYTSDKPGAVLDTVYVLVSSVPDPAQGAVTQTQVSFLVSTASYFFASQTMGPSYSEQRPQGTHRWYRETAHYGLCEGSILLC